MMNRSCWGNFLCTNVRLAWLEDDCCVHIRRVRIRQYITPLIHPWTTPELGGFSCSLFDDIFTPPPFNLQRIHLLLEVRQITYLSTHMYQGIFEGIRRKGRGWGGGSLEDGVSGVLRGLGGTREVCYNIKDIIIRSPSLDYTGCTFYRIGLSHILFCSILFSPILGHNAELNLLYCGHVDTWGRVWVQPASIILNWSILYMYHPTYLHLPIDFIDLMKR